jgi:ribosome-associated heat shock protein Hsp15
VRVDGERIKPARLARVGDCIEVVAGEVRRERVIRALSAVRGPAPVAQQLYEETEIGLPAASGRPNCCPAAASRRAASKAGRRSARAGYCGRCDGPVRKAAE